MIQCLVWPAEPSFDPLVAFGRVRDIVCCAEWSRKSCTTLAEYKLGDRFRHPIRSLFVDNFYWYSSPCFGSAASLLYHFVEDLSYHLFCHVVTCLDVFSSDSIVVAGFAFLELVNCSLYHFFSNLTYSFFASLIVVLLIFVLASRFIGSCNFSPYLSSAYNLL